MKLQFNTDLLPDRDKRRPVRDSFTHMFLFVKNENDNAVICGVQSNSGSQRYIPENKQYTDNHPTRTDYILKELKESLGKGATHLITGYYDIINDKWIEGEQFEINKDCDDSFIKKVFNVVLKKQYNEMYFNRELFLENLKSQDNFLKEYNIYKDDRFLKISVYDLFLHIEKEIKNTKPSELQTKDNKKTHNVYFLKDMIVSYLKNIDVSKENDIAFEMKISQTLEAAKISELFLIDKKESLFDYIDNRFDMIDLREAMESDHKDDIFMLPVLHERISKMLNL